MGQIAATQQTGDCAPCSSPHHEPLVKTKKKRSLLAMDRATVNIIIYVLNEQKIRDDVDVEEWFTLRD